MGSLLPKLTISRTEVAGMYNSLLNEEVIDEAAN